MKKALISHMKENNLATQTINKPYLSIYRDVNDVYVT